MINALKTILASEGPIGLFRTVRERVFAPTIPIFDVCKPILDGLVGLEIGGPSSIFRRRRIFPVYSIAAHIDNCNFSDNTIWNGAVEGGATFNYDGSRPSGNQFIAEATDLSCIASESYDFVLSSHVLEHLANPLRALTEWIRILRVNGVLVLVVPHKEGTFDHRRPVSTLQHLISDFENNVSENDMTHAPEVLKLHDLTRDPYAGDFQAFKSRTEDNIHNRGLHHHVFDTSFATQLTDYVGLQLLAVEAVKPHHIFVGARKLSRSVSPNNGLFLDNGAPFMKSSPFHSDRH